MKSKLTGVLMALLLGLVFYAGPTGADTSIPVDELSLVEEEMTAPEGESYANHWRYYSYYRPYYSYYSYYRPYYSYYSYYRPYYSYYRYYWGGDRNEE